MASRKKSIGEAEEAYNATCERAGEIRDKSWELGLPQTVDVEVVQRFAAIFACQLNLLHEQLAMLYDRLPSDTEDRDDDRPPMTVALAVRSRLGVILAHETDSLVGQLSSVADIDAAEVAAALKKWEEEERDRTVNMALKFEEAIKGGRSLAGIENGAEALRVAERILGRPIAPPC